MNLGDYIGDTRTDSLPPGFLKSIKIKYRHEASHVFAGLQPQFNEKAVKHCESVIDERTQSKDESREGDREDGVDGGEQNAPVSCVKMQRGCKVFVFECRIYTIT